MKILIVFPKRTGLILASYGYSFPVGLAYISSAVKKAGYSVDCLNLYHQNGLVAELFKKHLDSTTYSFVLTGHMSVGYPEIAEIIDIARGHASKPRIILGGPIMTTDPEIVYRELQPTYGVLGEGEETIVELLDFVINGKDLHEVNGIIYRDDIGNVIKTPNRKEIKDLDALPLPDCEGLGYYEQVAHESYQIESNIFSTSVFGHFRPYYVVASRSCPYQCTFCYHDSKFRQRSMESVFSELNDVVLKHKINYISVMDEIFATKKNKTRILEFCERIKTLQKAIDWNLKWECQIRVDSVDRELLKVMKESGCELISYGFETISPAVIKSMRKNIKPEQIDRALHDTLDEKITIQANFIFGDVAETVETANSTFDYFENNCEGQVHLCLLQPYPGSVIYKQSVARGLIPNELEFIRHVSEMRGGGFFLNMTNGMSDEEFRQMMRRIDWLLVKHRKATIPKDRVNIGKNQYHVKAQCPFCRASSEYNLVIQNSWHYDFKRVCGSCNRRFFIMSPYDYVVQVFSKYESVYLARKGFAKYIADPPKRLYYGRVRPFLKVLILNFVIRKVPFLKRRFNLA